MDIENYRKEIITELLKKKKANGEPYMTEEEAHELLSTLSNAELEEGIMFNSPGDIANLLIEIGRL